MDTEAFLDILKESIILTCVVIGMMMLIEVVNFFSKGKLSALAGHTKPVQSVLAGILGVVPGCIGGYVSVSMYTKRIFSFGALLSMMVATTGDEAFLMLALCPKTAMWIFAGLLVGGILVGIVTDLVWKGNLQSGDAPKVNLEDEEEHCHAHHHHNETCRTSLKDRLLHTLSHAVKVFLWTICILLTVKLLEQYVNLGEWVGDNTALMILLAALVGLIPQSGPHMVFITLFASGVLPLPVLLASCISQDGHAGLPLIAEEKKSFFAAKGIKLLLALAVGYGALLIG